MTRLSHRVFPIGLILGAVAWAQLGAPNPTTAVPPSEPPKDPLGRSTPRGTVLGFLNASRANDDEAAIQYLNTRLDGNAAITLAHQLYTVMDRRLPARLDQISDRPEGSMSTISRADRNVIGTITSPNEDVDIVVEQIRRGKDSPIWLFSSETLELIPDLYQEETAVSVETFLPEFMVRTKFAHIPLYEWLAVLLGLPGAYILTVFLNRFVSAIVNGLRRCMRKLRTLPDIEVIPAPVRLLLVAFIIRWMISLVSFPLLARQFWSSTARVIAIISIVWLFIRLNGWGEANIRARIDQSNLPAGFLRFARRALDVLAIFSGFLVALHFFGVNLTAGLAGLGIGGIAVALAAQKTLENVIGGISLIFDRALCVGDFLKCGDAMGSVEAIGLRSTRIRTLDRTVLNIPNGQISTASLEIFSQRDKFWFNPLLRLRYDTSASQLHCVLSGVRTLLAKDTRTEQGSCRVRFLRFGESSLEIEVFAYIWARDWADFLEIQETLLFQILETVQAAGTSLALPSRALYLSGSSSPEGAALDHAAAPQRETMSAPNAVRIRRR